MPENGQSSGNNETPAMRTKGYTLKMAKILASRAWTPMASARTMLVLVAYPGLLAT